jgi:hypothetical protein
LTVTVSQLIEQPWQLFAELSKSTLQFPTSLTVFFTPQLALQQKSSLRLAMCTAAQMQLGFLSKVLILRNGSRHGLDNCLQSCKSLVLALCCRWGVLGSFGCRTCLTIGCARCGLTVSLFVSRSLSLPRRFARIPLLQLGQARFLFSSP